MNFEATTTSEIKQALDALATSTTLQQAKERGREVLALCAFQKTIPAKLRDLEKMTRIDKVFSLCYNTVLSGEGQAVVKVA